MTRLRALEAVARAAREWHRYEVQPGGTHSYETLAAHIESTGKALAELDEQEKSGAQRKRGRK